MIRLVVIATLVLSAYSMQENGYVRQELMRNAFVTILSMKRGDKYFDGLETGVRVLGQSLRESETKYDYVVLCAKDVPERVKSVLETDGWIVKLLENYDDRQSRKMMYKLNIWRLTEYRTVVFIDSDAIVIQNVDELFKCGSFCASYYHFDLLDSSIMVLQPSKTELKRIEESMADFKCVWPCKTVEDQLILNEYFKDLKWAAMFNTSVQTFQKNQMRLAATYNFDVIFYYVNNAWYQSFAQSNTKILLYSSLGIAKPMFWWSYPLFDLNWKWDSFRARLPSKYNDTSLFYFYHWLRLPFIVIIIMLVSSYLCRKLDTFFDYYQSAMKYHLTSGNHGCITQFFPIIIQTLSHMLALYSIPCTMRPKPAWFLFAVFTLFYMIFFYILCMHRLNDTKHGKSFEATFVSMRSARMTTLICCLLFLLTFFLLFLIPCIISSFYYRLFSFILFIIILYIVGWITGQRLIKIWLVHCNNFASILPHYHLESSSLSSSAVKNIAHLTEREPVQKEMQTQLTTQEGIQERQENFNLREEKEQQHLIEMKKVKSRHQKDRRNQSLIISEKEKVINQMRIKIRELLKGSINKLNWLSREEQNSMNKELLKAASTGARREVVRLIRAGADIDCNNIDKDQMTPLHYASLGGFSGVVEELLCNGATPTVGDKLKKTPLHLSCESGHYEVFLSLVSYGSGINCQNTDRKTPLHLAAARGHTDIVRGLLEKGASNNIPDRLHKIPLHYASDRGYTEIVKILLYHGADVNLKDRTRSAAIHLACAGGHTEIIKILLEHNAEFNLENDWHSPLNWALLGGHIESAKVLLQHGASIDCFHEWSYSPVLIAMVMNHEELIEHILLNGRMSEYEIQMAREKYQLPPGWKATRDMHRIKYINLKNGEETQLHPKTTSEQR